MTSRQTGRSMVEMIILLLQALMSAAVMRLAWNISLDRISDSPKTEIACYLAPSACPIVVQRLSCTSQIASGNSCANLIERSTPAIR